MEQLIPLIQDNLASAAGYRPELVLTFGSIAVFMLDLVWRRSPSRRSLLTWATVAVLVIAGAFLAGQSTVSAPLFNRMIATDLFATFFKWLFLAAALLTTVIVSQG